MEGMLTELEKDFDLTRRRLEAALLESESQSPTCRAAQLTTPELRAPTALTSGALGSIAAVERELAARTRTESRLRDELMSVTRHDSGEGVIMVEHDFLTGGPLGLRLRQDGKTGPLRIKEVRAEPNPNPNPNPNWIKEVRAEPFVVTCGSCLSRFVELNYPSLSGPLLSLAARCKSLPYKAFYSRKWPSKPSQESAWSA